MLDRRQLVALFGLGLALPLARASASAQSARGHVLPSASSKVQVAVLLYENAILFDYGPPAEIFRAAEWTTAFNVYSVAVSTKPIPNAFFPRVLYPDFSFQNCPTPSVVIVPGGNWNSLDEAFARGDRRIADWLAKSLSQGATLLGVCTGAYVLALGGLLDGRRATSLPYEIKTFRKLAPRTDVREDMLFVDDGNIVTAAGGHAGIDAALHLVRRIRGLDAARFVAEEYLNYDAWNSAFEGRIA